MPNAEAVPEDDARERAASSNRENFPATRAIVDRFKAAFGNQVNVVYAEENGRTIGTDVDTSQYLSPVLTEDADKGSVPMDTSAKARKQRRDLAPKHLRSLL